MKANGKRIGKGWMVAAVIPAMITMLFFYGVAVAQEPPNLVILTEQIQISAEPASIPADDVSTSTIEIAVYNPTVEEVPKLAEMEGYEEIFSGKLAAHTRVDVKTALGELTDIEDTNNTGKEISVFTGDDGLATVLLSGNETGMATIAAEAVSIEDMINQMVVENDTTVYIIENSTEVEFIASETTPTPSSGGSSSGGNGGIPPTPPAGTPSYLQLSVDPSDIPADGSSISTLTASVWNGDEWVLENLTVNFSTTLGSITPSTVMVNGTATAILTAGTEEGVATITAEANLPEGAVTTTISVNFTTLEAATPAPAVVTATPTPAATISPSPMPTPTGTPSPSPTSKPSIPGFEAVFAIASLLSAAAFVLWRRR